jgi:uncharacterized surface protein with fasciclin (FAS1) repeats
MKLSKIAFIVSMLLFTVIAFVPTSGVEARHNPSEPTIVDIAVSVNQQSGEFSTLIAALQYTKLDRVLDGRGRFTVFAPTDAAFAKLGLNAGNITTLSRRDVTNILLYHITLGRRFSNSVLNAKRILMLNGQFIRPSVTAEGAFVNQSKLLAPDLIDIRASNGVVHVIDAVLIPPPRRH